MGSHPPFPTLPFMAAHTPLLRLFKGAARRGPGSEASTQRALASCRPLPAHPAVADFGCGSGASTLILARALQVPILALDADGTALDDLWTFARIQGLAPWVEPRSADMGCPGLPAESLDLLWSEGAIPHLGWESGLRLWRDLVRPGGFLALTEAVWLMEEPPAEAREGWASWYPAMGRPENCVRTAQALGLEAVDTFILPRQDWRDYYRTVEIQCQRTAGDPALAEISAAMRAEGAFYERFGHSYGYAFFVLRKP